MITVAVHAEGQESRECVPDTVPFSEQRRGNAAVGEKLLISKGWVGCGFPAFYYDLVMALLPKSLEPEIETVPGRPPGHEHLPYFLNRFDTKDGLDVIAPNCLLCHAGRINGELKVGLGNADGYYQLFGPEVERAAKWLQWGSWLYFWSPARRAEMRKVGDRVAAVAPYVQVPVQGTNPTHNLAWALVGHRDSQTLAWSEEPTLPLPPRDAPPSDVPPWWGMKKKNAMFAAAGGQGDHTGFMAVNSTLCADSVAEFEDLYDYFDDIRAYLASIEPPRFPKATDAARAAAGGRLFADRCEGCHGSYGDNETYPNKLVPLETIKTDPELARYNVETSKEASDWLNASPFTRDGDYAPVLCYVAPPLDGIWATAPYLHNGSVPTLAAVLDSSARPKYWTRSYDSRDYDFDALGWQHQVLDHGQASEPDPKKRRQIVDTTLKGFSNAGHAFGDRLTTDERGALLEYLKTL